MEMQTKKFKKRGTNNGFVCENCQRHVISLSNGSVRNHCPHCLFSKHVDDHVGDRRALCRDAMSPVHAYIDGKKGLIITHQCQGCGKKQNNKASCDDPVMPDNYDRILDLMRRQRGLMWNS